MSRSQILSVIPLFFVGLLIGGVAIFALPNSDANPVAADELRTEAAGSSTPELFSFAEFERFVPGKADLLIAARPAQFLNTEFAQPVLDTYERSAKQVRRAGGIASPKGKPDGGFFKNIELLMVASDHESLGNAWNYPVYKSFEKIRAQLQEGADSQKILDEIPTETLVNYLNQNFSGLIQYKKATDWEEIRSWFHSDSDFKGEYFESEWDGYKILECKQENTCAAIRLDERTYVVGNKAKLIDAISNPQSKNEQVSKWIAKAETTNFSGELFVGKSVGAAGSKVGLPLFSFSLAGHLGPVQNIAIAIDLKNKNLLDCDFEFETPEAAQEFIAKTKKLAKSLIQTYKTSFKASRKGEEDQWVWQAKRTCELVESAEFSTTDAVGTVLVSRPNGLEKWPKLYTQKQKEYKAKMSRQTPAPVKVSPVLVAKHDIEKGSRIQASDVKIENWPVKLIPRKSLKSKDAARNRKAKRSIGRGMPISKRDLVGPSPH